LQGVASELEHVEGQPCGKRRRPLSTWTPVILPGIYRLPHKAVSRNGPHGSTETAPSEAHFRPQILMPRTPFPVGQSHTQHPAGER